MPELQLWKCPEHGTITPVPKDGKCPICGATLIPFNPEE